MKMKRLLMIALAVLSLSVLAVFGISCGGDGAGESVGGSAAKKEVLVVFDVNTDLQTNVIRERSIVVGRRISEPKAFIMGDNPDNLQVYGWYTSKDCKEDTKWDFKKNKVSEDVTLYAKWVELHTVTYVVNGEVNSTVDVFDGEKIEESAEMVMGYKYLGSFKDASHSEKFDFNSPITDDTNIYVQCSEGLYLSDYEEEGLLSAGNLTDYLTSACGSFDAAAGTEEGWVEEYTIQSTGEKCTYVNFGLNPVWGDGYVELSLNLDISNSQIIRLTYKNIGKGSTINCYFTAMLDESTYSETGSFYNPNFNWPNYIGGPVGHALPIESNQSEDGEWSVVDFNLYEVYKNGYSVWGTSPLLGALRIEVNYKNVGPDDWANEMLIKSIEGVPHEIVVEDSEEIRDVLGDAMSTSSEEVEAAGALREENVNGFDFVKDFQSHGENWVDGNAEVFPTTEGMLMYAENEILARENDNATKGFTVEIPEDREISFEHLTTMNVTLQNFGYQEELSIFVYNELGVPVRVSVEINARMSEPRTYSINLYGLYGIMKEEDETEEHRCDKIRFIYTSLGVDNAILFTDVTFSEFVPFDTVGINFNDKFCYGYESNADVDVNFNVKEKGIDFDVKTSGATLVSPEKSYYATNDGYAYMSLKGKTYAGSNITAVKVELLICKEKNLAKPEEEVKTYTSPYVYEIDSTSAGAVDIKLPLVKEERGFVKAVRISFVGTGLITIKEFAYSVNETSLPYYRSYDLLYNSGHTDWKGSNNAYEYDAKGQTSTFIKGANESYLGFSIYIGFSANEKYLDTPHTTMNVKCTGKMVVTLVYQNRTATGDIAMNLSFDRNEFDPGDGSPYPVKQNHNIAIDSNMGDYEWSAISVVVEGEDLDTYLGLYLAKISFEFWNEQITIRAITIDVEA